MVRAFSVLILSWHSCLSTSLNLRIHATALFRSIQLEKCFKSVVVGVSSVCSTVAQAETTFLTSGSLTETVPGSSLCPGHSDYGSERNSGPWIHVLN